MTVNGIFDETDVRSDVNAGRLRVSIQYYAYAHPDHMPIIRKTIDFGDGSTADSLPGLFKNHRGGTPVSGQPGQLTPLCSATAAWGLSLPSCESNYFEEIKTYLCNQSILRSLPACNASNQIYPCTEDDACVFRPRVQIVDNWGTCNGSCPGSPGTGSSCINYTLDSVSASTANGDECVYDFRAMSPTGNKQPWTWFAKRIFVYPQTE